MTIGDGIFGATLIVGLIALFLFGQLENETMIVLTIIAFGVFMVSSGG